MTKLSARQLYFYLACIAPVGKLVIMPTQIVDYAQNDLLFPALINLLLQAGVIFCIMLLSRSEKTLIQLLEYTFGKVVATVLYALFALFLLYSSLFPLIEQKLLVQSVFYDTLPSFTTFVSFFLLSTYVCAKPFARMGRVWDLLAPLSVVGFFGIILLSISNADFSALSPVGVSGAKGIFEGTAQSMLWFYDSAILLLLMGNFRYEKGMAQKAVFSYLAGGAAVLLFLAVYYGIFSDIAIRQAFTFAKLSKYFSAASVLGRIDYIFICLLALVMAFYAILPIQASTHCIYEICRKKVHPALVSIPVNALLLFLLMALNFEPNLVLDVMAGNLFFLFPLFTVAVPLLCLLLRRSPRERKTA